MKAVLSDDIRRKFKRKFRRNVLKFYKQLQSGEAKKLPALEALEAYSNYQRAKRNEYL